MNICKLTNSIAYLRLNGVKAREHPVFLELTRVKQYFDKIKAAENPGAAAKDRSMVLDKSAAARFIKAGLVSTTRAFVHVHDWEPGTDLCLVRKRQV